MVEKHPKNFCMIKNSLIEAFAKIRLSGYETSILFAIIRKTYGFILLDGDRKISDWISLSQLRDMTGIAKSHISRTIKILVDRKIITKEGKKLGINKDTESWIDLPKGANNHSTQKLTKRGQENTKGGKKNLPNGGDTNIKEINYTKEIISKDIREFGNSQINECIKYFLEKMQIPTEDGSRSWNRIFWSNLIKENNRGVDGVKKLIDLASMDSFWKNNITSGKKLWYNRVTLIARFRGNTPKIAVMPKEAI